MHDAGAELSLFELILGREKTETTQIYANTSLKWLLELHGKTHPGGRVLKWDTDALTHRKSTKLAGSGRLIASRFR